MRAFLVATVAAAVGVDAAVLAPRQRNTGPSVGDCGLDSFEGHTAEASIFCSNILGTAVGTSYQTVTVPSYSTTTTTVKTTTTVYPTTSSTRRTTSTPTPTSTPKPTTSSTRSSSSSTVRSSSSSSSSSTVRTSSSTRASSTASPARPSSSVVSSPVVTPTPSPTTVVTSPSPSPTSAGCGIVAYVKTTQAYYFDSTGTQNTFAACGALCKADAKCKSFGYGEANCLLFDVYAADNTNYNPMSPYTFYDVSCPAELPVKKRQLGITIGNPGSGVTISLGDSSPASITSACRCFIGGGVTATVTKTSGVYATTTVFSTITSTASSDNDDDDRI